MNKKNIVVTLFLLVFLLAACGGEDQINENTSNAEDQGEFRAAEGINLNRLLFGSLILEDSENPISASQAESLIPLWKLAKSLSTSDTSAQEEIQVAVESIANEMTAEQLAAIENIELTPETMSAIFEELGISMVSTGGDSPEGAVQGSGIPGSGQPGSGAGRGGENNPGNLTPDQIATLQAEREANGGGRGMRGFGSNPELFDALIEMLEEISE